MAKVGALALTAAAVASALGCGGWSEPIVIGQSYVTRPLTLTLPTPPPPAAHGGGPSDNCHDPDLELDEPAEVPEGFEEGDSSPTSPAHPPHLKKKGVEENI